MSSAPTRPVVLAVVGASGGLGTSTLALAVARRLASTGPPSVAVDLDVGGGGLDVTAGVEHRPGRRWSAFAQVRGEVPVGPLLAALPVDDGCRLLSAGGPGPREVPAGAVADVLAALLDADGPVVLDVPARSPYLPDAVGAATVLVVVAGLRTRALADADACVERVVGLLADSTRTQRVLGLVTRGPRPEPEVVEDVVAHLGVEHVHHLADDVAVPRAAERGLWPGTGRDAVRPCADAVASLALGPRGSLGRAS